MVGIALFALQPLRLICPSYIGGEGVHQVVEWPWIEREETLG